MDPRVDYQPAFVLHSRPYRETSLLVTFFVANFGKLSAVAKGAQKSKSSRRLFQPFIPVQITWTGQSELKSLGKIDESAMRIVLNGARLYSGLYVNELLTRLLDFGAPQLSLFADYISCLQSLAANPSAEAEENALRLFELSLLNSLGYGLSFNVEGESDQAISSDHYYRFFPQTGFVRCLDATQLHSSSGELLVGAEILALNNLGWQEPQLRLLKRITRVSIDTLLGGKPLHSRTLYRQFNATLKSGSDPSQSD
ncbi:DNA repair protein RecO [Halioxenophilus sp. WMMB6]|uniref:DNA repair protein RecO n=1 Tax=Halioxenophilus sp. WMMB6 TaxID=3073815 RepID=UPI00295EDF07|nr:DNA repair protein RecO [Halioxenophilus sp. WMMB6]